MKELLFDAGIFYMVVLCILGMAAYITHDIFFSKKKSILLQAIKLPIIIPMYVINILLFDNANFSNEILRDISKKEKQDT